MSTHLTLSDRWRRWSYLQDVDLWLSPLSGRQRRTIKDELKRNLAEAAGENGMAEAIAELGTARSLARAYLDEEPRRGPNWFAGAIGAVITFGLGLYAVMIYTFGMLDALGASGGGTATVDALGVRIDAINTAHEISANYGGFSWVWLLAVVLVWLVSARAWRLFAR
ncbi:MAG: hypothetical protein QM708_08830 [Propioniciclava sp.]|uniref:HAAS signaling domain-containing protein n=1 Tax=Propioniciclava sp. TaxID=2038686 RepID=UPI0039E4454B